MDFGSSTKNRMNVSGDNVKLPIKVGMKEKNPTVLFAEVDRDFVDLLLSFLTLPLGRIVKLFQKQYGEAAPSIGCLNNLYNSLANLDDVHFWTKECKLMLLEPRSLLSLKSCRAMKLSLDDSPTKYYACEDFKRRRGYSCVCDERVSLFGNGKCSCGKSMSKELFLEKAAAFNPTMRSISFTVSDDLQIVSNASDSFLQNLHQLCTSDIDGMTTTTIQIGLDNAMDLLKSLFVSRMPLTDLVLRKKRQAAPSSKDNPKHDIDQNFAASNSRKYFVKALIQKSTNQLLFVQAKDDFVDFLFSLLVIPLGVLAHLFGGNTPFICINNLHQSVYNLDKDDLLMTSGEKASLLELPQIYSSSCQILPLSLETVHLKFDNSMQLLMPCSYDNLNVVDPKCNGCYIRGPAMFLVKDDLTVMPSTILSDASRLSAMKIPISDVEEVKLEIGVKEALRILNASLTSTKVFTDALAPVLKKQPKQESDR